MLAEPKGNYTACPCAKTALTTCNYTINIIITGKYIVINFTLENKIYIIYQYFNLKRSFELLKIKFQGG